VSLILGVQIRWFLIGRIVSVISYCIMSSVLWPCLCFGLSLCGLGTTSQSCNIRLLLASVCWQIASVYGRDTVDLPTDYPSLVAHFHSLLTVSISTFASKKVKVGHTRLPSVGFRSWSRLLAVSLQSGDVSHKPGGRLTLLSVRPAVALATLKRVATNFADLWTGRDGCEQFA